MLVCDDTDDHPQYKERPCFIAEVLSPGTASIDAHEKWLHIAVTRRFAEGTPQGEALP